MGCVCVPDQVGVGQLSLDSVRERGPAQERGKISSIGRSPQVGLACHDQPTSDRDRRQLGNLSLT